MRKALVIILILSALLLSACADSPKQLIKRADELCHYIPDHELLEKSRDFMTTDFYAVLDTMFYRLPAHEAMDHEWLYYFVTGNGGTIADFTVTGVTKIDKTHATATVSVRQKWEDGSFDPESDIEEHQLSMEKVDGVWLMSDFDGHKQDCINYIANNRKEQALRDAISDYLVKEIGPQYKQGEFCIPTLMIVAAEETGTNRARVWGDFWIWWYNQSGDTLMTVSGGNHSGLMGIVMQDGKPVVTAFVQTVDGAGNDSSARTLFGSHYDIYQNIHSNQDVREAVRREQLSEYVKSHNLNINYYKDYGWDAVKL
ncbi:MAG: hypothetical protein IKJ66_00285 [Bacteroidaceae bacterium]|nr:hypothetical protein [Bacteroidaceae bacterium]